MTGKDLLLALGDISPKYYEEAENEPFTASHSGRSLRRSLLIAAAIALALLLVGCAIVYALRLQDMSIGKEVYTQSFDENGKAIDPVEKTRDVITLYGHSGEPVQLALAEWFAFLETYDPDGVLRDNNPDHPEILNRYEYTYSCYTPDMVKKLDEIAAKYGLKLLDEWIPFQAWQSDIFLKETGIGSLVLPESGAEITRLSGMYYPPYNFGMEFSLKTEAIDTVLWGNVSYARKDYFPRAFPGGMDLSRFAQWDHKTPDGTRLLLALDDRGSAYIIAEQSEAMLIYSVNGNFSGSAYPKPDETITREQLEAVADVFNYAISPKNADRTAIEAQLREAQDTYDAANTFIPETYGSVSDYLKAGIPFYDEALQYCFYDLTGDGEDAILIGKDGGFTQCFYEVDGEVHTWSSGMTTYVCENGILEEYLAHEIFEDHTYMVPDFQTEASGSIILFLNRTRGKWSCTDYSASDDSKEITEEAAKAIMDRYPRVQLHWLPLMEYPISEGTTLGDYLNEKDARISGEALREIYRNFLLDMNGMNYSHYRMLDINGDGVEDLLLKGENDSLIGNTDFYWCAFTYRYGAVQAILMEDFYLCENGVLEKVSTRHAGGIGVEKDGHQFLRCNGFGQELYELVIYNKSTAGWQTDWWDEEPISEETANAILAKYPRIDQGMRPISELLG